MNTGSVEGGTGWYLVVLGQNRAVLVASVICFQKIYGLHGVHHQIIQYSEKGRSDDGQTDRQTNRISYLRLDPFCGRGRVKITLFLQSLGSQAMHKKGVFSLIFTLICQALCLL